MNKTLLSLLVASSSFLSINAYATTNIESDWWIKWSDIKKQGLINENQTCDTLKTKSSLTEKQQELMKKNVLMLFSMIHLIMKKVMLMLH